MHASLDKSYKTNWKFFGVNHSIFKLLVVSTFVTLIIVIFNRMYSSYYYERAEGDLVTVFSLFLTESAIALILLLPYSYMKNYWARALLIQFLFAGWFLFTVKTAFDYGGLYYINSFGVGFINMIIFALFVSSLIADHLNNKRFEIFEHETRKMFDF